MKCVALTGPAFLFLGLPKSFLKAKDGQEMLRVLLLSLIRDLETSYNCPLT